MSMRRIPDSPLWVGHAGDARDLRGVLSAGIQAVVDLAENEPALAVTRELVYLRFPLVDGAGNPPWLLRLAVETVVALLQSGVPTLVFCGAGMSRTPCVAGAALAVVRGCTLSEGLAAMTTSGPADVSPGLWAELQVAVESAR
jgi:protein-tyrosine phosphatase